MAINAIARATMSNEARKVGRRLQCRVEEEGRRVQYITGNGGAGLQFNSPYEPELSRQVVGLARHRTYLAPGTVSEDADFSAVTGAVYFELFKKA
jgi:hypothetical protein